MGRKSQTDDINSSPFTIFAIEIIICFFGWWTYDFSIDTLNNLLAFSIINPDANIVALILLCVVSIIAIYHGIILFRNNEANN